MASGSLLEGKEQMCSLGICIALLAFRPFQTWRQFTCMWCSASLAGTSWKNKFIFWYVWLMVGDKDIFILNKNWNGGKRICCIYIYIYILPFFTSEITHVFHSQRSFIKESYVTEMLVLQTLRGLPVAGSHFYVEVLHVLPQINGPPAHNVSTQAL